MGGRNVLFKIPEALFIGILEMFGYSYYLLVYISLDITILFSV